jgi:hypothetical protein
LGGKIRRERKRKEGRTLKFGRDERKSRGGVLEEDGRSGADLADELVVVRLDVHVLVEPRAVVDVKVDSRVSVVLFTLSSDTPIPQKK